MAKKIAIIGNLDTHSKELQYLKNVLTHCNEDTMVIDIGWQGTPSLVPDVNREQIAQTAGRELKEVMARGSAEFINGLFQQGQLEGIIGLGDYASISIVSRALEQLPPEFPTLLVSMTEASFSGQITNGTVQMLIGTNSSHNLREQLLANAAFAIAGMVKGSYPGGIENNIGYMQEVPAEANSMM